MKKIRPLIAIFLLSLTYGCAGQLAGLYYCEEGFGPLLKPEFENTMRKSLPISKDPIEASEPAVWYPYYYGYSELRMRTPVAGDFGSGIPGVLVLTPSALYFTQWDPTNNRYVPILRLIYSSVGSVNLDNYKNKSHCIVLQNKDYSTYSFVVMRMESKGLVNQIDGIVDQRKTEILYNIIRTHFDRRQTK